MLKKILCISGSDSGGGAGMQADIKTVNSIGAYPLSVITAVTAQNTVCVADIEMMSKKSVKSQLDTVSSDIDFDAVKIGMLGNSEISIVVESFLKTINRSKSPVIWDPVLVASSKDSLFVSEMTNEWEKMFMNKVTIMTPNIPEAESFSGMKIHSLDDMITVSNVLLNLGCGSILLKGGHLEGDIVHDVYMDGKIIKIFTNEKIEGGEFHGTGCILSAAIATYLAQGESVLDAIAKARDYVLHNIRNAIELGKGSKVLTHASKP